MGIGVGAGGITGAWAAFRSVGKVGGMDGTRNGTASNAGCSGAIDGGGEIAGSAPVCLVGAVDGAADGSDRAVDRTSDSAEGSSTDGRGIFWMEGSAGIWACFSMLDAADEADGGAGPGLRAGARGLKLVAPFFFKRELMAQ